MYFCAVVFNASPQANSKSFALKFKLCQSIFAKQRNQFPQFIHVDGRFRLALTIRTLARSLALFAFCFGSGLALCVFHLETVRCTAQVTQIKRLAPKNVASRRPSIGALPFEFTFQE